MDAGFRAPWNLVSQLSPYQIIISLSSPNCVSIASRFPPTCLVFVFHSPTVRNSRKLLGLKLLKQAGGIATSPFFFPFGEIWNRVSHVSPTLSPSLCVSPYVSHFCFPLSVSHFVPYFVANSVSLYRAHLVCHTVSTLTVKMWPKHGRYLGNFSP